MVDYNLSGLSSRSFEQLIQALATQVIGPGTLIFGDGPDGGREATFEGPMNYPTGQNGWNGYLVIQAKFKQRTQDSPDDGEWALEQLKKELQAFVNSTKNRRLPDYYIFATNVVLSPVSQKGKKDKASILLADFAKKLNLKGYALWDYDQIRVYLDNAEAIRRAYAAWITPGDVLSSVIEWLQPEKKDFEQIITNFLQKELQTDEYVNLEQAGHAVEDKIPIARVFIDAPALDHFTLEPPEERLEALPAGFVSKLLETATERLDLVSQGRHHLPSDRLALFPTPEAGRFVLIGGPGQGKTTFSQFICQLFRAALLKTKSASLASETLKALTVIESQSQAESIPLPTARRFPIRLVLSEFAAALAREETNSLVAYIVARIRHRTNHDVSVSDLRKWLAAYPWLLILDGLDEVPASSNREDVLSAIRDFWVDATECNSDILVVATTRPQGYSQDFSGDLYRHLWLVPLSTARALHYAQRLVNARYGNDPDRREKILTRLRSASSSDATARLMRSPLQVTIMAALVDKVGKPPQERWTLFRDYYKVIYDREVERDIPAAEILRDYKPDVDTIHYRVGLLLQIEGERTGSTDARLSSARLTEIIHDRLVEEEHADKETQELQQKITKAAAERLVFLAGLESDRVGFEIRSFQEFMAAECLMEGDDKSIRERLREIATISYWRNVFLFAAGKCFAERQHLRDTILALCAEMNDDPEDEALRITLAGSQLALDLLEDGPARRQPKYAQALARLALKLLGLESIEYPKRLAEAYDSSLAGVYRSELEDRLKLTDGSRKQAAWGALGPLMQLEVSWANELVGKYWPKHKDEQIGLFNVALTSGLQSKLFLLFANSLSLFSTDELRHLAYFFRRERQLGADDIAHKLSQIDSHLPSIISALDSSGKERTLVNLRLPAVNEPLVLLSYAHLDGSSYDWQGLSQLTTFHSSWAPYVGAARFLEHPSKVSLAAELRFIALSGFSKTDRPRSDLPWPIGACVEAAKNTRELLTFAERAEAGGFGDLDDWKRAEVRWKEFGVSATDFEYATDEHWPYDDAVGSRGFPFNISGFRIQELGDQNLMNLIQVYDDLNEGTEVHFFLGRLLYFLITEGYVTKRAGAKQLRLLLRLAADIELPRWFDLTLLTTFEEPVMTSDAALEFMDYIGKSSVRLFRASSDDTLLTSTIAHVFPNRTSLTGLLRIFSYLSSADPNLIPTSLLTPELYPDPAIKESAIIIRLRQKNLDIYEQQSLARSLSELFIAQAGPSGSYDVKFDFLLRALNVVRSYKTGDCAIEAFLLELRRNVLETSSVGEGEIVDTLAKIIRLRLSTLRDPAVWTHLQLPRGLGKLLRT